MRTVVDHAESFVYEIIPAEHVIDATIRMRWLLAGQFIESVFLLQLVSIYDYNEAVQRLDRIIDCTLASDRDFRRSRSAEFVERVNRK